MSFSLCCLLVKNVASERLVHLNLTVLSEIESLGSASVCLNLSLCHCNILLPRLYTYRKTICCYCDNGLRNITMFLPSNFAGLSTEPTSLHCSAKRARSVNPISE